MPRPVVPQHRRTPRAAAKQKSALRGYINYSSGCRHPPPLRKFQLMPQLMHPRHFVPQHRRTPRAAAKKKVGLAGLHQLFFGLSPAPPRKFQLMPQRMLPEVLFRSTDGSQGPLQQENRPCGAASIILRAVEPRRIRQSVVGPVSPWLYPSVFCCVRQSENVSVSPWLCPLVRGRVHQSVVVSVSHWLYLSVRGCIRQSTVVSVSPSVYLSVRDCVRQSVAVPVSPWLLYPLVRRCVRQSVVVSISLSLNPVSWGAKSVSFFEGGKGRAE